MAVHSAQAAAISQPIPPTASASRPLLVHLSLSQLSGPVDPPKPDVFDELDHARFLITVQIKGEPIPSDEEWRAKAAPGGAGSGGGVGSSEEATALADRTATLFPGLVLDQLRPSSSAQGEELPDWLKEASGKVTSLAAARMPLGAATEENSGRMNEAHLRNRQRPVLRVAAGCEDGSLWLFTSPDLSDLADLSPDQLASPSISPETHTFPSIQDFPRTSLSTLEAALHPHSSRPLSPSTSSTPPTSPHSNTRSRRTSTSGKPPRPALSSRRSSITSISLRRVSSSNSISTLATFEVPSAQRPRKASATVCVSTAVPGSSSDISFPQSPPPPALVLSSPPNGRRGHRAKDSITTGIGLWEQDSVLSLPGTDGLHSPPLGEVHERTEVEEELRKLGPLARVRIGGRGQVVGTAAVEGMRCAKGEGGKALVVLRRDGMLSLHSWVDGRAFDSCDVASTVLPAHHTGAISFDGLEVLNLADETVAICYGRNGVGLVIVDLETLHVHEAVSSGTDIVRPTTFFKQGVHYIVYAAQVGPTSASHLLVRPVIQHPSAALDHDSPHAKPSEALRIESPHDAGALDEMKNGVMGIRNCADDLLAFDESGLLLFTIRDQRVVTLGYVAVRGGIVDVCVEGYNNILVSTYVKLRSYRIDPSEDAEDNVFNFILTGTNRLAATDYVYRLPLTPSSTHSATFLVARSLPEGSRVLESISTLSVPEMALPGGQVPLTMQYQALYESSGPAKCRARVTCVVNLDRWRVLLGYSSGAICVVRYADLEKSPPFATIQLPGAVTALRILELGGRQLVVAGSVDGSAAAWQLDDWDLIGQWSLFASPVSQIVYLQTPNNARLSNTVAFISANSPVALVSLFPPQLLFVLPGTKSAVESISTAGDEVLVVYTHGLSRVCDVQGQELRRSMDYKTAVGVLADGSWTTWFSLSDTRTLSNSSSTPYDPMFSVDLRKELEDRSQVLPWAEARRSNNGSSAPRPNGEATDGEGDSCDLVSDTVNSREHLGLVRRLLSQVVTFGLDRDSDSMLEEQLQVSRPYAKAPLVLDSDAALCIPVDSSTANPWTLSPAATAQRLLQIVCLLRVFLNFPDTERYASQIIVFYASMLADAVGPSFVSPSLDLLADFWLDKSAEVQQSARVLFGTYLAASSDSEIETLVERWQDFLPARQVTGLEIPGSEQAVLIIGLVAADKFKLLSATTLKDLSTSISTYLDDEAHPYHQAIAAELCSRGFEIWQHYLDAMVLVRQLFGLATGRNPSTPNELRNLARLATLHVAGINTPLFMTTLSFDILNAQTAAHRSATMKLLGFMVRKKPLVLYSSLPRLAEAVVKSLDPTVTALRETVQQAATVILGELVRTYPSIDFHGKSQRLAVGTHEGAAIVYDLKTATRLYVLEGHKRAITALSWSPDGRRLVSVSLEESKAVVWKVGVGIFSMFTPGAPPRQGSGGTATPFKTLDFNVGDEGLMTTAATLEWVGFEWPGERTTRLRIRETALTFSV